MALEWRWDGSRRVWGWGMGDGGWDGMMDGQWGTRDVVVLERVRVTRYLPLAPPSYFHFHFSH